MTIIGNIVIAIAFIFLGPLPILEVETQLSLIQGMVAVVGLGYGMIVTSSFCRAQATALQLGYDDNINTYLVISGNQITFSPIFKNNQRHTLTKSLYYI